MIPASAVADARAAWAQTGVSGLAAALALAVAGPESAHTYDPTIPGDYMLGGRIVAKETPGAIPTSWGYTQLHTADGGDGGGLGAGYSISTLTNGVANFSIAMREIQRRLDQGMGPRDALGPWSARDSALLELDQAAAALGTDVPRGNVSGEAIPPLVALAGIAAVLIILNLALDY